MNRVLSSEGTATPKGCNGCQNGNELDFAFTMAFQPVVDVQEHRIVAHEALVRGLDGAGAARILTQVTVNNRYKFDQACRVEAIRMASSLGLDCNLNINFLPNAVYEPAACIRSTLDAANRYDFPISRITFEFVEQEDVAELAHMQRIVREYRRIGFQVALDDFGTGYSGLSRLAEMQPDIVKLDRSLIKDCDQHPSRLTIAASMIELCQKLGTKIVIEGVETKAEVLALQQVGARYMQGFFFARPAFQALVKIGDIAETNT